MRFPIVNLALVLVLFPLATRAATPAEPSVTKRQEGEYFVVYAHNPLPFEIDIYLQDGSDSGEQLDPGSQRRLKSYPHPGLPDGYRWVLGPRDAQHAVTSYRVPLGDPGVYEISQGFEGAFTHGEQPNLYAVDLAAPVGTRVVAARAGVVVRAKDDYHMGGTAEFFLDKSNFVTVAHEDGTYANYHHLLQASVVVEMGQQVTVGEVLGRSGSSGFSSGPHLHFSVNRNAAGRIESLPFQLREDDGKLIEPRTGKFVIGW